MDSPASLINLFYGFYANLLSDCIDFGIR